MYVTCNIVLQLYVIFLEYLVVTIFKDYQIYFVNVLKFKFPEWKIYIYKEMFASLP